LIGKPIHLVWADPLVGWFLQVAKDPWAAAVIGQGGQPRHDVDVEMRKPSASAKKAT
jgi:hypothetical protein